jgi:hypothetical protein
MFVFGCWLAAMALGQVWLQQQDSRRLISITERFPSEVFVKDRF